MPDDLVNTWSPRILSNGVYLVDVVRNRGTSTFALADWDKLCDMARHMDSYLTVDAARPLPDWATADDADDAPLTSEIMATLKPMPAAAQPDSKAQRMAMLIVGFRSTIYDFEQYGELTGHHIETLPAKRELEKLIARLEREIARLNGQPVEAWGEL